MQSNKKQSNWGQSWTGGGGNCWTGQTLGTMRRWNWTVRSAIVAVVVLAATLLVSEYYKWRRRALPWYSDTAQLDSFHGEILQHRKSSGGNPTTGQHLSVPLSQAGLANAASINVSVKSPQATVASRTPGSSPIVTTALPPLLSPVAKVMCLPRSSFLWRSKLHVCHIKGLQTVFWNWVVTVTAGLFVLCNWRL